MTFLFIVVVLMLYFLALSYANFIRVRDVMQ